MADKVTSEGAFMRACIIWKKISLDVPTDGLSAYHAGLFHGRFKNKIVDDKHWGDELSNPLKLSKNAYQISPIFQPQRNLVVSEKVKDLLAQTKHVNFHKVEFEKLFSIPFAKHDHSVGPDNFNEFESWLGSFTHDETLAGAVGDYYELILPLHSRVMAEFSSFREVEFPGLNFGNSPKKLKLSSEILEKYPILWTNEGIVFNGDVFEVLEGCFERDYFVCREIKV